MASLRTHTRIARSADDVWNAVSDAGGISTWFPAIEQSTASGSTRSCTLAGGGQLEEDIVNVDDALRRFQHRITAGMPVEHHPGTVDVLEDGEGQSLVVYSTPASTLASTSSGRPIPSTGTACCTWPRTRGASKR